MPGSSPVELVTAAINDLKGAIDNMVNIPAPYRPNFFASLTPTLTDLARRLNAIYKTESTQHEPQRVQEGGRINNDATPPGGDNMTYADTMGKKKKKRKLKQPNRADQAEEEMSREESDEGDANDDQVPPPPAE